MHTNCSLDCRKIGLATGAAFLALNVMEFLLHGVALMGAYMDPRYQSLWNSQEVMGARRWPVLAAYLVMSAMYARVYAQGYQPERGWCAQGLRYGLMIGALVHGFHASVSYMVYPVSAGLASAWFVGGVAESAVLGLTVAAIYRPAPAA